MATEYGPRIRAARGFAGLSQGALASKLGREVQWVKRREAGEQEPQAGDLLAIAAATGAPVEFLEHGFTARVAEDPDLAERVEALEAKLQTALGLARARDERVSTLENHLETVAQLTERLASLESVVEPIIDLAGERTAGDLANGAERRGPGETGGSWDGEDRRRPGQGSARR